MRFRRLSITGFGGLRDREIVFGDGITMLLGANEAGKSTVLHCLAQVLMGKPSQRSLFPDFTPWDGGEFAAMLEFTHEDGLYRLTRRFGESGTRAVSLCQVREDGSERLITREASEVRVWVAAAFGTADDRIFYRVFCLTQADLTPLDHFAGLREHVERATSGADVAVTAALQHIDARLASLRRGIGQPALRHNWGALKRAEDARLHWEARLHDARRQQRRLGEVREAIEHAQEQLQHVRARIVEIESLLARERAAREQRNRLNELQSVWDALEQERDRYARLSAECDRLREKLASLPPVAAHSASSHPASPWLGWGMLLAGLALGAAVFFKSPAAGLLLALLGMLAGIAVLRRRRTATRATVVSAETRTAVQREFDAVTLALATLGAQQDATDRRRAMAIEITMLQEQLSSRFGESLTVEAAHRLEMELQQLRAALPAREQEERELARELAVLESSEQETVDIEDGVVYWRQEEARAREEEQTLLLAYELLREAGNVAHGQLADPLAARIAPLFAAMTDGRYPQVRVTGDAQAFNLHPVDAAGVPVPTEQLSRGTYDQFVLAVRLALGQVIAGPEGTPAFLFDDPLLHFDHARRAEALAMLTHLAEECQIILATHDERLLAELPGAVSVNLRQTPVKVTK